MPPSLQQQTHGDGEKACVDARQSSRGEAEARSRSTVRRKLHDLADATPSNDTQDKPSTAAGALPRTELGEATGHEREREREGE